jgi:uncharacterized protein (TIGR02271 family)
MTAERPTEQPEQPEDGVVRSEERLHVGSVLQDVGRVLARKLVGTRRDTQEVERSVEEVELDRTPAEPGDTGEVITLPDGSLSIPVFEEQVVVEKRLVVRERVVLRKYAVAHTEQVEADVRVEHVEVVAEPQVSDRVDAEGDAAELVRPSATAAAPPPPVEEPPVDATDSAPGPSPTSAERARRPGRRRDPKARP